MGGDIDDEAYGMNESGEIVGYADSPDGRTHALLWTLVRSSDPRP